jgi:hypothetical protein
MGPIKIGLVGTITHDPFESAPHAKSSIWQSSRAKIQRFADSTTFDNRNETAPRKRSKVLNIIKASKAANANCFAAARAKELDRQMEKALGDFKKQQQAMSILHKLEMAKMTK